MPFLSSSSIPNFRNSSSICNLDIRFWSINISCPLTVIGQRDKEIVSTTDIHRLGLLKLYLYSPKIEMNGKQVCSHLLRFGSLKSIFVRKPAETIKIT